MFACFQKYGVKATYLQFIHPQLNFFLITIISPVYTNSEELVQLSHLRKLAVLSYITGCQTLATKNQSQLKVGTKVDHLYG